MTAEEQVERHAIVAGVYFLFANKALVYVGQSTDVYKRIAAHRRNGRQFDYAGVMAVTLENLQWVEAALIKATEPKENKAHARPPAAAPIYVAPEPIPQRPYGYSQWLEPSPEERARGIMSITRARSIASQRKLGKEFQSAIDDGQIQVVDCGPAAKGRSRRLSTEMFERWVTQAVEDRLTRLGFRPASGPQTARLCVKPDF